jgi:hypothetical protein
MSPMTEQRNHHSHHSIGLDQWNLSSPVSSHQHSPFGPLNQPSSRRTLFYLIATLNASFPDYDFR